MPETRCETVSELDSLHDVHSPYLDSNWRGEYKNDLPTSFTAVAVADRQVSMPKQSKGGCPGSLGEPKRRAREATAPGSRFTSDSGRVGRRPRPDANGRLRADPVVPARNGIAQYESVQSHLCSWSAYGAPVHGMALDDERQDTRRGVLKNLAAAGLGAAIGTVAARQFPPWPSEPGVGVPEISGPGTLDAVFNVRDQGAVGDGAADDTGALIRTIGRVPVSGGLVYLPHGTYRVTSTIAVARTNVWIFGSGPDATAIRLGDGANADVLAIDAGGCTVSILTIDGNKAHNSAGSGILVDAVAANEVLENATVRDLHIVRTKGAGIRIRSSPSGPVNRRSLVQSCVVDDTDSEGIALMPRDQSS